MPRYLPGPRKRRTREHIIADLSVNHVERQILERGFTMERWVHDYGIDLVLSTYTDEGETEVGWVTLQVKATDHLKLVDDGRAASVRIERAHLRTWLTDTMPVILIIYDAQRQTAYWLYVQAAFKGAEVPSRAWNRVVDDPHSNGANSRSVGRRKISRLPRQHPGTERRSDSL